ncbi:MAG: hypothetical protein AMJ79_14125 [Phycisphaerae bacterium SM23_30]|nr:MAG: hypothetical protein AMJ79_14125 [Phycisphaerae bacterium SM23_30]
METMQGQAEPSKWQYFGKFWGIFGLFSLSYILTKILSSCISRIYHFLKISRGKRVGSKF